MEGDPAGICEERAQWQASPDRPLFFSLGGQSNIKSQTSCYNYNSIYKFFVHALQFDPPPAPLQKGGEEKEGGEEKVPFKKR